MSRSSLITALCANARLVAEALATTRRAIIITSAAGLMLLCTDPAQDCLERYFEFDKPDTADCDLPDTLRTWMARHTPLSASQGKPPEPVPALVVDKQTGRLTVELIFCQTSDRCLLLLEEENLQPSAARLQKQLGLTAREAEVLFWVSQGKMNAGIAILLGLRIATVEKHLEHIFAKLKVENRTMAARHAHEVLNGRHF